jgi:transposase
VRIHIAAAPIDLRRGFDGLANAVRGVLGDDPMSGHLFVFHGKRGNLVRILFWDRTGYCVLSKRLERGRFHLPRQPAEGSCRIELTAGELLLMLEGLDLTGAKRERRWTAETARLSWR